MGHKSVNLSINKEADNPKNHRYSECFEFLNSAGSQADTITDYSVQDTLKFYITADEAPVTVDDYNDGILNWGNLTIALGNSIEWDDLTVSYA